MNAIFSWIAKEWAQTSTHVWLAGAGGSLTAYATGHITGRQFLGALVISAVSIIIPQGAKQ